MVVTPALTWGTELGTRWNGVADMNWAGHHSPSDGMRKTPLVTGLILSVGEKISRSSHIG